MLSLEHRFLKLDWTNRYFLPDKSFLEPWGVWGGEGRTEPLLWGKPRVTRFPPGGRTLLGPAASASPLAPCAARVEVSGQPAGPSEIRSRKGETERQAGGSRAAWPPVPMSWTPRQGRLSVGWVGDTNHSLGALRWSTGSSAQLGGASRPQRDAWLEDLPHSLLWRLDVTGYSYFFFFFSIYFY